MVSQRQKSIKARLLRSMHHYGTATLDESSPHYAGQVPVIVERHMKPVWMDEAGIRTRLDREYRPGEEIGE